jgi:hypothetical protein
MLIKVNEIRRQSGKVYFCKDEQTPHLYFHFADDHGHYGYHHIPGILGIKKLPGREAESSTSNQYPFSGSCISMPGQKDEAGFIYKIQIYIYGQSQSCFSATESLKRYISHKSSL